MQIIPVNYKLLCGNIGHPESSAVSKYYPRTPRLFYSKPSNLILSVISKDSKWIGNTCRTKWFNVRFNTNAQIDQILKDRRFK